jgi:hypothetical protein
VRQENVRGCPDVTATTRFGKRRASADRQPGEWRAARRPGRRSFPTNSPRSQRARSHPTQLRTGYDAIPNTLRRATAGPRRASKATSGWRYRRASGCQPELAPPVEHSPTACLRLGLPAPRTTRARQHITVTALAAAGSYHARRFAIGHRHTWRSPGPPPRIGRQPLPTSPPSHRVRPVQHTL